MATIQNTYARIPYGGKILALILFASLLSVVLITAVSMQMNQAASPVTDPNIDPHTLATGTMETTTEVIDGVTHKTYFFSSDDLKKNYGYSTLMREEQHQSYPGEEHVHSSPQVTTVQDGVQMKVILESEGAKLDAYQEAVNGGIPMNAYMQWSLGERTAPESSDANTIIGFLQNFGILQKAEATHVQNWAHKQQAYSPYDPIDIIWTDPVGTGSSELLTDMHNRMIAAGWGTTSTCFVSTTLYVNIGGVYTAQTQHKYRWYAGVCDQYHVRLWKINSNLVIGAAHKEFGTTSQYDIHHVGGLNTWEDNATPYHALNSFELGESQVRGLFVGSVGERFPTCWTVSANAHSMSNTYSREYWNTARTTLQFTASNTGYASTINQKVC